jgi:hypothetical protein
MLNTCSSDVCDGARAVKVYFEIVIDTALSPRAVVPTDSLDPHLAPVLNPAPRKRPSLYAAVTYALHDLCNLATSSQDGQGRIHVAYLFQGGCFLRVVSINDACIVIFAFPVHELRRSIEQLGVARSSVTVTRSLPCLDFV